MKAKLWGTRGSISVPGPETVKYGGNTSCLELRFGAEERLVIIDAGTGIRPLANDIMKKDLPKGAIKGDLFFSHTHWDHIIGFPFFVPLFIQGTELRVYGPVTCEETSLEEIIGGQLQYHYFPVKYSELSARIEYIPLKECEFELGDGITVKTKYLNHPILCLGYRFESAGKALCTVYDHEPFRNLFPTDPEDPDYDQVMAEEGEISAREENEKVQDFLKEADLVIHDCQYTKEEYLASKKGWGHSYFEYVIDAAEKAGVRKIVLTHHDPLRTDKQLDELEGYCRSLVRDETALEILIAREGMEFVL